MKIDEQKLLSLHSYLQKGGSTERPDIAKHVGEKDPQEYIDALKAKWPKIYGGEDETEVEPQISKSQLVSNSSKTESQKEAVEGITKVVLINEDGFGEDLKIISNKNGKLAVERIVPTDEVTIKVAGKDVVVDVLKLRKMVATEQLHGVSVQTLILLAGIAKGV